MNITNEQATYLIGLKKKIVYQDNPVNEITIDQKIPFKERFILISEDDKDYSFLWEITQSRKDDIRISLHYQENENKIGLFRVDYNSGHKNPEIMTDDVPLKFKHYVGKVFTNRENHLHYYVKGYRMLAWAMPIGDSELKIKDIDENNMQENIIHAIKEFAAIINLKTEIKINKILL